MVYDYHESYNLLLPQILANDIEVATLRLKHPREYCEVGEWQPCFK